MKVESILVKTSPTDNVYAAYSDNANNGTLTITAIDATYTTLTFASNLVTGDVIDFIQILGSTLDLGVPSNDTVGAAQIKDDLISGTTALASEPADTDEFLVSDAGTIKRVDYSYIKGGGKIGQVVSTFKSDAFSSTADGFFDITGLSVSITPSATSSKVLVISDVALSASDSASYNIGFKVLRGSTSIGISTAGASSSLNYSGGYNLNTSTGVAYMFGNSKISSCKSTVSFL